MSSPDRTHGTAPRPITQRANTDNELKPKSLTLTTGKGDPASPGGRVDSPKKIFHAAVRAGISKFDFGEKRLSQLDIFQFHMLRKVCERRISAIMGEERSVELLRIPGPGKKPVFYPLVPPIDPGKNKGIFGVDLYTAFKKTATDFFVDTGVPVKIPNIVQQCLVYLSEEAVLKTDGIFRKPGHNKRMTELQELFDTKPMQPVDFTKFSVHDVAGLLKRFVRELPEPVFTMRLQNFFFASLGMADEKRRLVCLQLLLIILPKHNRDLLFALMFFLKKIANNSGIEDGNRMDPHNLAVVFAPNIAKNPTSSDAKGNESPMTLKQAQEDGAESMQLVELLINHCEDLFSFQFKKVREFPLNRGDSIVRGKKLPLPEARSSPKPGDVAPEGPLSNTERFLRASTRSKEELLAIREQSLDPDSNAKAQLSKNSSAPNPDSSQLDDDFSSQVSDSIPIPRSKKPTDRSDGARNSLPNSFDGPLHTKPLTIKLSNVQDLPEDEEAEGDGEESEGMESSSSTVMHEEPDHYAAMQEQSAQLEEGGAEASDDDSDNEEGGEGPADSPTVITAAPSGRVFEGPVMNKALALRINKDLKNKRVFLFGDITMKQGLEIFKKLHKNAGSDSVIESLLPIDFSVNFEEMKIQEVCDKMKNAGSGVEIKNRRKNLRLFKNCFVGKEAMDWLCSHAIETKELTRLQAQIIAREMLELGLIEQAFEGTTDFKDDNVYYRFPDHTAATPMSPRPKD